MYTPLLPNRKFSQSGSQIHCVPSPPYTDPLRLQCRERLLSCLADLTQLSAVTRTAEKVQRTTGATSDGKLWVSRVVEVIRKLEQDSKHVTPLSQFGQDDRRKLERACETVARLSTVRLGIVSWPVLVESL